MWHNERKLRLPTPEEALPGRAEKMPLPGAHALTGNPLAPPFPEHTENAIFGMGCFWGAEKQFWSEPGVHVTAVGYSGGLTPNPTYEEVCSGRTGHNEVVLVVFDPGRIPYEELLRIFWEGHDPTQGMRQGNDIGTQYRSGIYYLDSAQWETASRTCETYQSALKAAGHGPITTEIVAASDFFYAEGYHQQYLAKNPFGYCGLGGTGVSCPTGLDV